MWYLLEDLLEQPLIMKAFIAWGWLSIWIMVFSGYESVTGLVAEAQKAPATEAHAAPI